MKNSRQLASSSQSFSRLNKLSRVGINSSGFFSITSGFAGAHCTEHRRNTKFGFDFLCRRRLHSGLKKARHRRILIAMSHLAKAREVFDIELAALKKVRAQLDGAFEQAVDTIAAAL